MLSFKLVYVVLSIVVLFSSRAADAQARPEVGTTPTARFRELVQDQRITFSATFSTLPDVPPSSDQLLINGTPVDSRFFPTIFRMTTGGTCTAALVGEAALLTAAHCVPNGALIRFVVGTRETRGVCEQAPGYHPQMNPSEDWALCLLEFPIIGIKYETISASVPPVGTRVVLTGYGCIREDGPLDGMLRLGISDTVDGQSDGFAAETSTIYTKSSISGGGAILCPGDSGGPLFTAVGNPFKDARSVEAVNSRTTFQFGVSLFAATGSAAGRQFFNGWAERHSQPICGVNTKKNCR